MPSTEIIIRRRRRRRRKRKRKRRRKRKRKRKKEEEGVQVDTGLKSSYFRSTCVRIFILRIKRNTKSC